MKGGLMRIGVAVTVGLLGWGPAQAQLLGGGGLPGIGLSAPPALPTTPSLPTAALPPRPAVATPRAQASAQAAESAAVAASRLPTVNAADTVATLELSTGLKPQGLGASRDALGEVSLKAVGAGATVAGAADGYRRQAAALLAQHPEAVEPDADGRPAVRGEILALDISPRALAQARAAGFSVRAQEAVPGLGMAAATLGPPRGVSAQDGLQRLRALDPAGRYDLDHIYFESGATAGAAASEAPGAAGPRADGRRLGLVDGAAPATIPSLKDAHLVQQPFAPGGLRPTAHGAAVASLLVGEAAGFRGAAAGATLYVADVYGSTPAGGSALAVVRALGWLAQARVPVVNISLVGPPNAVLAAGVAAMVAKGHLLVAAVGNDGPAAPPLYPAAYPGVVAVTGVDARRRVLPEAGRGSYVAFAAPGAGMLAAGLDGSLSEVRGTSFAAPLVAGRLAALLPSPDPARAVQAVEALGRQAIDLGARGRDPIYGRGLVAFELATRPASARYAAAPR